MIASSKKKIRTTTGLAVAALCAATLVGVQGDPATAEPLLHEASAAVDHSAAVYGDVEVIAALVAGQGQLINDHPVLAGYLPSGNDRLTAPELDQLKAAFIAADPEFHSSVTIPFQSGDPFKVESALNTFRAALEDVQGTAITNTSDGKCLVVAAAAVLAVGAVAVAVYYKTYLWPKTASEGAEATRAFAAIVASEVSS
jgi:hypothetical protein